MQEQFGYGYDKAWNLANRTNNSFVSAFMVNNLNELSTATPSGTFTVAGDATESRGSVTGTPPGVTNVTVNNGPASLYADGTFAATNFSLMSGNNTFTAIGKDTYGRLSTSAVTASFAPSPSYGYDLNGNLTNDGTRNFAYDVENELVAVWVVGAWSNSFDYDGLQRRRIEQDYTWTGSSWQQTNEVFYVYDGNLVVQERNQNNLPLTTYTRGADLSGTLQGAGGAGGLLARSDSELVAPAILLGGNGNSQYLVNSYYHNDGSGNITTLVQPNGFPVANYEYDPFGNAISMSGLLAGQNKYRFSSKEWNDNAGLYYYLYRFYDPELGRWANADPVGEFGFSLLDEEGVSMEEDSPSSDEVDEESDQVSAVLGGSPVWNRYVFVFNSPTRNVDSTGLDITLERGDNNPWYRFLNNIFHEQVCVCNENLPKKCFSFGAAGFQAPEFSTTWLGWHSWVVGAIIKGQIYAADPVSGATIKKRYVTTAAQDNRWLWYMLNVRLDTTDGYSVLRHNCRKYSQWEFRDAPLHW